MYKLSKYSQLISSSNFAVSVAYIQCSAAVYYNVKTYLPFWKYPMKWTLSVCQEIIICFFWTFTYKIYKRFLATDWLKDSRIVLECFDIFRDFECLIFRYFWDSKHFLYINKFYLFLIVFNLFPIHNIWINSTTFLPIIVCQRNVARWIHDWLGLSW